MALINRQWTLARYPTGAMTLDHFAYREEKFDPPALAPGEIRVRSRLFRFLPALRSWMNSGSQVAPAVPLGAPLPGAVAAEVLESRHDGYPPGTIVSLMTGWQDYAVVRPDELPIPPVRKPENMTLLDFEGLYGVNSLTAYFGLLRVGEPRAGETLLVSGASGSTGLIAAQIGLIKGCRVIGLAGGRDKCRRLVEDVGLTAAIDYKTEDVSQRLASLCPNGVNVFYDNVGGSILETAIEHMAPHGRIVLCGQISSYEGAPAGGVRNMMRLIYHRLKLQGFVVNDYDNERDVALRDLARWAAEGRITHHADVVKGFALLPATFLRLFDGSHFGTMLLEND